VKNILITGVSKGIGRSLAEHFSQLGYFIYGGYKFSDGYQDEKPLADELEKELDNLKLLPYDLADRANTRALVSELDGVKLSAIINNAGEFMPNRWKDFNFESWDRVVEVNMSAPLVLVQGLKDNLLEGAAIVNISSTDALYAGYDDIAYSASKAGLNNLTKSMAAMLANKKIRVNAVAPGWVDTDMAAQAGVNEDAHFQTPLGRNASTKEIAQVVEFLISAKASFVNAAIISVDGGYSSTDYVIKKESEK
jgi:3-oxoacyl-[acyl-carrier protein] reductase